MMISNKELHLMSGPTLKNNHHGCSCMWVPEILQEHAVDGLVLHKVHVHFLVHQKVPTADSWSAGKTNQEPLEDDKEMLMNRLLCIGIETMLVGLGNALRKKSERERRT